MASNTLTITTADGVQVYHVYQDVKVQEEIEVSRLANRGASSILFNHGKLPIVLKGTIECKGNLFVGAPGGANVITQQQRTADQQLTSLRSLLGQIVTIDCRNAPTGGVRGIFRQGETNPDLEWDEGAYFAFELLEGQEATATTGSSLFGTIDIFRPPLPVAASPDTMPGSGEHNCTLTTKTTYVPGPISIAVGNGFKNTWNDAKQVAKTAGHDIAAAASFVSDNVVAGFNLGVKGIKEGVAGIGEFLGLVREKKETVCA